MSRALVLIQTAAMLLAGTGCAKSPPRITPSMPERVGLGVVAVVAPSPAPASTFPYPVPSRAGAAVAGAGAGLGMSVIAATLCAGVAAAALKASLPSGENLFVLWLASCLFTVWTPVTVVNGGIEGAIKGVPISDIWGSASALKDAALAPELPRRLAEAVTTAGAKRVGEDRVRLAEGCPGPDTILEVRFERIDLERFSSPDSPKGYGLSLSFEDLINASLRLVVEVRARVLRAADGTVLYEAVSTQRGGDAKLTQWAEGAAAQFRSERDRLLQLVAEDVADRVFGPAPSPPEITPSEPKPDEW